MKIALFWAGLIYLSPVQTSRFFASNLTESLIYPLFALSGIAGLIYEGTWARYLKLFLGHSSYGQILTLCIYMGGLGLGSFVAARWLNYIRRPLRAYALVELIIGFGGLFYHDLYEYITTWFYSSSWSSSLTTRGAEWVKIFLAITSTTPIAVLLGMTFPWIAAGLIRRHGDSGRISLPTLYFSNSLGAAIGLLAASYWLIPQLGTQGTLRIAALVNIVLAIAFSRIDHILSAQDRHLPRDFHQEENEDLTPSGRHHSMPHPRFWLALSALTGLTSFIYEVVWIRLLSLMMGSSTHSFDQMVAAFILGLAGGSLVSRHLLKKDALIVLALAQIGMGFLALSTIYTHPLFFNWMNAANLLFGETEIGYVGWSIFKFFLALAWMVPTSFFAGMTLPCISYLMHRTTESESSVGKIYGWNTAGAIAGSALAGLLMIPVLQLKWSLLIAAYVDVAIGVVLLWFWRPEWRKYPMFWTAILLICLPAAWMDLDTHMVTAGVFRGYKDYHREEQVWVSNGKTATISFHESRVHSYIKTNGKPDASIRKDRSKPVEGDELTQAATAFIPMATRNAPYSAVMVGFGSGMSAHYLLADPLLEKLDIIEIEEEMVRLSERFRPINARAFDDPRVDIFIDDARTFFHTHRRRYDLIVSVPSNPWVSGVSSLFSVEFYHHIRRYLNSGGVLVQWLQLYEFDNELLLHILKALHETFPQVVLYRIPEEPDLVILASDQQLRQDHIGRFAETPEIRGEFEKMRRPWWSFGEQNFLGTTRTLQPLLKEIPANSEYIPWVDNRAEATRYTVATVGLTFALDSCDLCWPELLDPEDYAPRRAFKNWLKTSIPPDPYLRSNIRHHLERYSTGLVLPDTTPIAHADSAVTWTSGAPRKEMPWEPFWKDFRKFMAQLPFDSSRDSVPEYRWMQRLVSAQQIPLDISLEFEFMDHLCHGRYQSATRMLPVLREVFFLVSMDQQFLRNLAIAAFLARDTRELRRIFDESILPSPYMDNAEKRLIATLLGKPLSDIPLNTPKEAE